tara:strand:+ start:74 stop:346 length:273 start_codon:yes stop_codon:yes gene_type:complete
MMKIKTIKKDDEPISIKQAQEFIGGYVTVVKLVDGKKMIVMEDALLKAPRPPINIEASKILNKSGTYALIQDVLGNAIVIEKDVKKGWYV